MNAHLEITAPHSQPRAAPPSEHLEELLAEQAAMLARIAERLNSIEEELRQQTGRVATTQEHIAATTRKLSFLRRLVDPFDLLQRCKPRLFVLYQYSPQPLVIPPRYHHALPPADPPTISIVTPSYQQADYLPRTIASVLDQKYPRLEYVVQDGGSTDGSVDVIRRHAAKLTHWASQRDDGQASAINRGFAHTSGPIMGWLNSDDLLLPGALNYVANYFAKHPEVDVVYGHRYIINERDQAIGTWLLPGHDDRLLRWVDYVPQETLFWRREIWERAGGMIDESFDFAIDWDLLLRFQAAGARMVRLPRFLGAFRVTTHTKTSTKMATVGQAEVDRLRKKYLGFVPTYEQVSRRVKWYQLRHLWRRLWRRCGVLRD